ncbi:MAG: 50S ribosomal protein L29 [Nitrospina sp.]|jgi:large subunit ribosomal protein L29|nr:50S ribosomal protein L29 [Nitrospina sp.]MBT3510950.1 50S ribosomal protein L29 [Nitrospina sp.]MBT3875047.1 50S ribosomal protein L29 [Nitrospina sp.]MBT4047374.1 50S ribosomal protein L29 [Nitrospina sp.]MBT4558458.1 50S ribosomal protein L29 [Nitrospina sp.]
MKAEEIRGLSEKEREEKVVDITQEIFNLKFQLATGKIENPSRLRDLRRDVARLKTIQRENQASGETSAKQGEDIKASSDK